MENFQPGIPTHEQQQHLIIAFQHLLRALVPNQNLPDDFREILQNLDSRMSSMVAPTQNNDLEIRDAEKRLRSARETIKKWDLNQTMIWDSAPMEACEHLKAVVEIHRLVESLRALSVDEGSNKIKLLLEADCLLQESISRLEMELIHILAQNKQSIKPEAFPLHCYSDGVDSAVSIVSGDENLPKESSSSRIYLTGRSEEYNIETIHPKVIPHLKLIANAMFALDYDKEFCQAFVSSRIDALDEYLINLGMEKYRMDGFMKMEWFALNTFINKWIRATKIIIGEYLVIEKKLCDQIFERFETVNLLCFIEISKMPILRLLNYGFAIAMGPHGPEKLFRLLDMYKVVSDLLFNIDALFSDNSATSIKWEFDELLLRLSSAAKSTFLRFGNEISSDHSTGPLPGGGIHPLTSYVMNYIRALTIYSHSLNDLLKEDDKDDSEPINRPIASQLKLITSHLISNLEQKSELYRDEALQSIFLMNNIHYMVRKVKDSDLGPFFGNEWIRSHIAKFQKLATMYERLTWGPVLLLLGVNISDVNKCISKTDFKKRCRSFDLAFEEIYEKQTGWSVPDPELRDELQISSAHKVVHAYQTWLSRNQEHDHEKHVKYNCDDLGKYMLDFFEAKPRSSLHNPSRRRLSS